MWRARIPNGTTRSKAVSITLAAILALLPLGPAGSARAGAEGEAVLVRVNGTPITRDRVREIVKNVIASSPAVPSGQEIDQLSQEALDSLIDLELLYQEAEARKIELTDESIDAEIAGTRAQFASAEEFAAALQRSGMTESELRQETRKALLANRLLESVAWQDIDISEDAVEKFYRENRKELGEQDQLHLRHILINVPAGASAAEREKALLKASQLRAELEAGGDFERLASQYSDDPTTASKGGDLGFVANSAATAPLIEAGSALETGAFSGVVETADGYHLVQLVARRPGPLQLPPEMRQRIRKLLEEKERRQRQAAFLGELRRRATIEFVAAPTDSAPAIP